MNSPMPHTICAWNQLNYGHNTPFGIHRQQPDRTEITMLSLNKICLASHHKNVAVLSVSFTLHIFIFLSLSRHIRRGEQRKPNSNTGLVPSQFRSDRDRFLCWDRLTFVFSHKRNERRIMPMPMRTPTTTTTMKAISFVVFCRCILNDDNGILAFPPSLSRSPPFSSHHIQYTAKE